MTPASEILSFIINLFSLYLDIRMMKLFTERREQRTRLFYILFSGLCVINWFSFQFIPIPYLATVITFFCLLVISILCFQGTLLIKVVSVLAGLSLGAVSEEIIWHFLSQNGAELSQNGLLGSLLSSILTMMFIVLIESLIKINKNIPIPVGYYLSFLTLFVSSIILGEVIVLMNPANTFLATLGLGTICFMNIALLFVYGQVINAYQKTMEKEAIKQNLIMYQNQMNLMQQSNQQVRSLQHDLKNHLLILNNYIQEDQKDESLHYIDNIASGLTAPGGYADTGNNEVDCILNYYLQIADQNQCDIKSKISVPTTDFMSVFDLNTLLSNLMQNAIEALADSREKKLNIVIRYDKGNLYISIYNSFEGARKPLGKLFQTTKYDFEHHGYGLQNIQKIVEKYHGVSAFSTEDNYFKADLLINTADSN